MIFYYSIFLIISIFSFAKRESGLKFFVFAGVMLFFIAAFRGEGIDRDYQGYIEYYNDILESGFENVEPSFIFITEMVNKFFGSNIYLFIIYALLGIFIKLYAINKLSPQKNIALLVYYSGFFFLHEMTQIRVGIAAGLLLLCIKPIQERDYKKFIFFSVLAFFFHYSAVIIFPLYFLSDNQVSLKKYSLLLPIAFFLYYFNINIYHIIYVFDYISIDLINLKIKSYEGHALLDSSINIFNFLFLSRCLVAYILFLRSKELAAQNKYFIILLKVYFIGLFVFVAFSSVPGISSRGAELLFIVEIILIPALIGIIKEKIFGQFMVIGASLASLSFLLFGSQLINPYF